MKHLQTADTFVRQIVKRRLLKLRKISGRDNVADILTKHVTKDVLEKHWPATGWSKHDESSAVEAKLDRVNTLADLRPTDEIVRKHVQRETRVTTNLAVSMSKGRESIDPSNESERTTTIGP